MARHLRLLRASWSAGNGRFRAAETGGGGGGARDGSDVFSRLSVAISGTSSSGESALTGARSVSSSECEPKMAFIRARTGKKQERRTSFSWRRSAEAFAEYGDRMRWVDVAVLRVENVVGVLLFLEQLVRRVTCTPFRGTILAFDYQ